MTRNPDETKRRLFDAAVEEFADHGIAGARVDRIASRACANKQLIYAYYGDKQQLIDMIFGLARTWVANTPEFRLTEAEERASRPARRAAVVEATRRLVTPR